MADWEQSIFVVSYNQPKLCSNATWSANGTVVYRTNISTVELHAISITRRDQIYIPLAWKNSVLIIDRNNNSCIKNLSDISVSKFSIFVTDNDDLYVGDTAKNLILRVRSNGATNMFITPPPPRTLPRTLCWWQWNVVLFCLRKGHHLQNLHRHDRSELVATCGRKWSIKKATRNRRWRQYDVVRGRLG